MKKQKIDFVILWVDNKDEKWQEEKRKYEKLEHKESTIDNNEIRYRDWENLKYWFRGVEKYAPWVNQIHFITCGHLPNWLNTNHKKLHIVKHSDYMPKDSLPTFNSNAIELLIHKIDGLSEQFVLFNDDIFIIDKVKESDFFKNGIPCNTMSLAAIIADKNGKHYQTIANNMEIINSHFDFRESFKKNSRKYLSLKQGKYIIKSYPMLTYRKFSGFANFHLSISYLKSTFEKVWEKEEKLLNQTVHSKFRDYQNNISHWVFNYWQFAEGNFEQKNYKFGLNLAMNDKRVADIITNQKYKMIGLGDVGEIEDFEKIKKTVNNSFEKILSSKSSFEK